MINCNALKCISCYDSFKYIITHEDYGEKLELKEYNSEEVCTYYRYYIQDIKPILVFEDRYKIINFRMHFDHFQNGTFGAGLYVYINNKNMVLYNAYQGPRIFKYYMDCNISAYESQFFIESIYGNTIERNPVRINMKSMIDNYFISHFNTYYCPPIYPSSGYYWDNEPFNLLGSRSNGWNYYYRNMDLFDDFLKWK